MTSRFFQLFFYKVTSLNQSLKTDLGLLFALAQNTPQKHANADCYECSGMDNVKPQFAEQLAREKWDPKERAEKT